MTDIREKVSAIYSMEQLASNNTAVHRLDPVCKLLTTMVFIVTVMTVERHGFGRLVPFVFYPLILASVSETPQTMLIKRVLVTLPFGLFIGLSNLFLERDAAFAVAGVAVSYGALSLAVIIYRTYLCVTAVLLLISTTPFTELTGALRKLRAPNIFVIMFEMTYRYIGVLFGEAASMRVAYALRNAGAKGVDVRHAGSFIGCLLLRSFDRAERIYAAMKCRGYALRRTPVMKRPPRVSDTLYCVSVCACCLLFRLIDVGAFFVTIQLNHINAH